MRIPRPPPTSSRPATVHRRASCIAILTTVLFYCLFQLAILGTVASKIDGGWDTEPNTQYHIQTDEGPERYFKYQTISGQYRKERRLQDGSVVGTYGWVDADGYLRLNDYVADSKGYRIVKNKKLFVGNQAPVGQAVSAAKYVPAVAGTAVSASPYRSAASTVARPAEVAITQAPPRQSSWRGSPFIYPSDSQSSPLQFPPSSSPSSTVSPSQRSQFRRPQRPSSTASSIDYYPVRPIDVNSIAAGTGEDDDSRQPYLRRSSSTPAVTAATAGRPLYEQPLRPHTFRPAYRKVVDVSAQGAETKPEAEYDGVSFVRNGFKYYLPRHYHEEQSDGTGDTRTGSFGYVDPFGIRRVVYYNTAPGTGFVHRKNNRYVGLNAEPYDPRPQ